MGVHASIFAHAISRSVLLLAEQVGNEAKLSQIEAKPA
jgi:hypothetical protein